MLIEAEQADPVARNEPFAAAFPVGEEPSHSPQFAVVTCMDARLDPVRFLGLGVGEAHVIRNAGGLVTGDALRSLVISHWLFGTRQAFVIAHTDCGMMTFTNEELDARLREETGVAQSGIDFLPFADLEQSVAESLERIRESPLLAGLQARGYVYDVLTGRLREVA
jgi:carbonic anhydrase